MKRPTLAVLLTLAGAVAQKPVFRTGTHLVEVQVVVRDKAGKPVFDLDKRQFRVLEDGKPRDIAFFLAPAKQPPSAAKPLPAGVFTNRPEFLPGASQTITAILLDFLNTSQADQLFAKAEVAKYLCQKVSPSRSPSLDLASADAFLRRVAGAPVYVEPAIGLGNDVRIYGPDLLGGGL
jgi:VWFA-related protein